MTTRTQVQAAVLAVEDDANDALILGRAFAKAGVDGVLHVVRTYDDAIAYVTGSGSYGDRAKHPAPALVFLDLKLPGSSGFDVLRWIRTKSPHPRLPVVVLTSSRDRGDVDRAYDLGANTYLVKPVGFQELLEMVQTAARYWLTFCERPTQVQR